MYICSDDIHETSFEESKTPATYHSPEPIIKKTVVNRDLVSKIYHYVYYYVYYYRYANRNIDSFLLNVVDLLILSAT